MNSAEFNSLCRPYKKVQHLADLAKSSKKLQRDVAIDFQEYTVLKK
jgi:hypothetical protein